MWPQEGDEGTWGGTLRGGHDGGGGTGMRWGALGGTGRGLGGAHGDEWGVCVGVLGSGRPPPTPRPPQARRR